MGLISKFALGLSICWICPCLTWIIFF